MNTIRYPSLKSIYFTCISLFIKALSLYIFIYYVKPLGLYSEKLIIFYIFITFTSLYTIILPFINLARTYRILILIWTMIFVLFTYQFGIYIYIRLLLLIGFFLEVGIYERFPSNMIICNSVLIISAAVYHQISRRYITNIEVNQYNEYIYLTILELIIFIICVSTRYHENMLESNKNVNNLNKIIKRMSDIQQKSLEYAKSVKDISTQNERNRVSSELHDSIGYTYTNIKMIMEACKDLLTDDKDRTYELLEMGLDQISDGFMEIRKALYQIREQDHPIPYLNEIHQLINVFQKTTGIQISVHYANMPNICDYDTGNAFYHVIKEGLVNALCHGNSTIITISFWSSNDYLKVIVSDNGRGATSLKEGIGLLGMQERVGRLGGTLNYHNSTDGFVIVAEIPKEQ